MTTYNTGNPIGSNSPFDFSDNSENIDVAVNSEGLTWVDRLGVTRLTLKGMEAAAASGSYTVATIEDLQTITPPDGAHPAGRVTEGPGAGFYIWDGAWIETVDPLDKNDSQTINIGKPFPLKVMNRGGVVSEAGSYWENMILSVRIFGPSRFFTGKIFRIGRFANGFGGLQGITLIEYDEATYESDGVAGSVIIHGPSDAPIPFNRDGGIQFFSVVPRLRPEMRFDIVVNADGFPAAGTPISANNVGDPAYSWAIDKSCHYADNPYLSNIDQFKVNQGKIAPMYARIPRAGVISPEHPDFNNCILGAYVVGAKKGHLYRFAYMLNNAGLSSAYRYGVVLEEFDKATYEASAGNEPGDPGYTRLHTFTDPSPDVIANTGIQIVQTQTVADPDITFIIVYDTDRLPPNGSALSSLNPGARGRSHVIAETNYQYRQEGGSAAIGNSSMMNVSVIGKHVAAAWETKPRLMQVKFQPNGFNDLPNILGVSYSEDATYEGATYTPINETSTDFLRPMIIRRNDTALDRSLIFTGGNHGSPPTDSVDKTARNIMYEIFLDGQRVAEDKTDVACERVTTKHVNELMASNTINVVYPDPDDRYVLRESFQCDITAGKMTVHCKVKNISDSPLSIYRDYGCQMSTTGFNESMLILDAQNTEREPFNINIQSGVKTAYPDAWMAIGKGEHGTAAIWADRSFGVGTAEFVQNDRSLLQGSLGGATGSTKFYNVMVYFDTSAPMESALILQPGETYEWRGGYVWDYSENLPVNLDSIVKYDDPEKVIAVYNGINYL